VQEISQILLPKDCRPFGKRKLDHVVIYSSGSFIVQPAKGGASVFSTADGLGSDREYTFESESEEVIAFDVDSKGTDKAATAKSISDCVWIISGMYVHPILLMPRHTES
jgi:hypothetical protein